MSVSLMENYISFVTLAAIWFLFCIGQASCRLETKFRWSEMQCPDERAKIMKTEVPWGIEGRAYKTLPKGLTIAPSKMNGAGFGVISNTFIPKFTWLGEYDGVLVTKSIRNQSYLYSWRVHMNGTTIAMIDAFPFHLSSYHRYVNAPLLYTEENVLSLECYGKVLYITTRDIYPGKELLVSYGHAYAIHLGVDINIYFQVPDEYLELGLDLNKRTHRIILEKSGIHFFSVKDLTRNRIKSLIRRIKSHH